MTFNVILHFIKNLCLHVDILEKFKIDWALNKKCIVEKDDLKILRLPLMTFMTPEVILCLTKNMRFYIVSIHNS